MIGGAAVLSLLIDALIVAMVVAALLPISTAFILRREWRAPSPSLHERSLVAFRDALVAGLAAAMAINRLLMLGWDSRFVVLLLAIALLLVSLPSAYWLWLYFGAKFNGRD